MNYLSPSEWKEILFQSMDNITSNKNAYFEHGEKDFSRTQKISLRDTMLFPMVADNDSTAIELQDFFPEGKLPSQAAMSCRRDQLKPAAFKAVFDDFSAKIPRENTFLGLNVIACDGSRINTPYNPKDLDSFVDKIKGRRGFNQLHLTACYDLMNDVFTDAVIQGYYSMNEKLAFIEMMDRCCDTPSLLFVADRGFASYNVVAHAVNDGHKFLIRLPHTMARNIFIDSLDVDKAESCDIEDTFYMGRVRNKVSKNLKNYHFVRSTKRYDYIELKSDKIDQFHVRLVKLILPSGEPEFLLTNLLQEEVSLKQLQELYWMRWGIEVSFRHLKYASGMVHMHSIKPRFIFQEIYAKLTLYNYCTAVEQCTSAKKSKETKTVKETKYKYLLDRTYLTKTCIRFLKDLISDIITLVEKRKVPVRAGRNYERNLRRQHADTLQYR